MHPGKRLRREEGVGGGVEKANKRPGRDLNPSPSLDRAQ